APTAQCSSHCHPQASLLCYIQARANLIKVELAARLKVLCDAVSNGSIVARNAVAGPRPPLPLGIDYAVNGQWLSFAMATYGGASVSYAATAFQTDPIDQPFSSTILLEALADGVVLADGVGIIRQVNSTAARLLGVDADALLGRNLSELPGALA